MEKNNKEGYNKLIHELNNIKNDGTSLDKKEILNLFNQIVAYSKEVSSLALFSGNEEFDEIDTENLKFLLITYYQGELLLLLTEDRKKNIKIATQFFEEFYKVLFTYQFLDKDQINQYKELINEIRESESIGKDNSDNFNFNTKKTQSKPDMEKMKKEREAKIKSYKEKKELIEKIKYLQKKNQEESREFYCELIRLNWKHTIENLAVIKTEIESLSFLEQMKANGKYNDFTKPQENKGKLETLKITPDTLKTMNPNDKLLNNVQFGCSNQCSNLNTIVESRLNYKDEVFKNRNAPTMTLDEFADTQIVMMEQSKIMEEQSKIRQQEEEDLSDAEEEVDDRRKKEKRAWDDWKDLNERGGGNKGNK